MARSRDLDAANIQDVETFFKSYYGPNNAVLAIAGDVKARRRLRGHREMTLAPSPAVRCRRAPTSPRGSNSGERTLQQTDALAQAPALALGWKMPARGSKDHAPAAVLSDLLLNGKASRLYQSLVKGKELLLNVTGGMNFPLGDPWSFNGPTLLVIFGIYKPTADAKTVVAAIDGVVADIAKHGVPAPCELERVKIKMEADFYDGLEDPESRALMLATLQQFSGNAASVNDIPGLIRGVTSDDLKRVAATYLTVANRTVIDRQAGACHPGEEVTMKTLRSVMVMAAPWPPCWCP